MDNNKLLPEGFCDLINQEAFINHDSSCKIVAFFQNFGYDLVKTPLLELDSTLKDYQKSIQKSFQIFDVNSGQNLTFRSDITAQISRLMATRLRDQKLPLRLCYLGDILKISNRSTHSDRQITQAGIELIGSDNIVNTSFEVVDLTIGSLKKIGVKNITIDFSIPNFLDFLIKELNLGSNNIKSAIEEKDIKKITRDAGDYASDLVDIVLEVKDVKKIRNNLLNLKISNDLLLKFDNLLVIINKIQQKYSDVSVLVNIFDGLEFSYHEDVGFSIFTKESLFSIAKGGSYKINKNIAAVGSSIYINLIKEILLKSDNVDKKRILVSNIISDDQIDSLQKDGYITIRSLDDANNTNLLEVEARKLGLNHIYFDSIVNI